MAAKHSVPIITLQRCNNMLNGNPLGDNWAKSVDTVAVFDSRFGADPVDLWTVGLSVPSF